jgi:asparagine synthase (glutamine-hydrolysing)
MRFQMLLGEKTFFEGITLLPPASILRVETATLQIKRQSYWNWNDICWRERELSQAELIEEAEHLLRHAVNTRLEKAERPGIFLSGGLDSRLILALVERNYQPITTITYGHRDCRDVHLAAKIARTAGANHHHFELENGNWVKETVDFHLELTEGAHSWVHAHGMSILPQARQLIDVNLSGISGPITGISSDPALIFAPDQEALLNNLFIFYTQHHTWPGLTESEAAGLYTASYQKLLLPLALDSLRAELAHFDNIDPRLRATAFNITNRDRRMIANFLIFNNSHFENRCPFYDYKFAEWAVQLPPAIKAERRIHRALLSRVAPKLALIPYDKNYSLPIDNQFLRETYDLYTKVRRRTKKLFHSSPGKPTPYTETLYADYENYLRHELRGWAENILFDERTLARGIFRPEALHSLMDRHVAGHELHTIGKIAPIMTFEMVMRRFFDTPADSMLHQT